MNIDDLKKLSSSVNKIVGEKNIKMDHVSNEVVTEFYTNSYKLYRKFHSPEGAMHYPVSFSVKETHKNKLLYQADYIHSILGQHDYSNVLELGCGNGFNSIHLANKNEQIQFTGIDLTPHNIQSATLKSNHLQNVHFLQMDFDKLDSVDKKYDLIFAVETLCYSKDLIKLLTSLKGLLTANGRIVIFDGYEKQMIADLKDPTHIKAYNLLCWGYAMKKFQHLDDVYNSNKLPFKINDIKEYSENILPNATVAQNGCKKALLFPLLLKLLIRTKIMPLDYMKQITAGLFTAYFVKAGYLGYFKVDLSHEALPPH